MKSKFFFLFVFLLIISFGFAQNSDDPDVINIDRIVNKCLNKNPSTQGSAQCYIEEQKEWDKILNKYYKVLKDNLSEEGKQALLNAQREWIKMRDKEFAFIDQLYLNEMSGTMYYPMAQSAKANFIKKRALKLKFYFMNFFSEGVN